MSEANDIMTRDLLIACVKQLTEIEDTIGDNDEKQEAMKNIAEKYNTGNIIEFGEDIEKRIELNKAENKFSSDSEVLENILSRIEELENNR